MKFQASAVLGFSWETRGVCVCHLYIAFRKFRMNTHNSSSLWIIQHAGLLPDNPNLTEVLDLASATETLEVETKFHTLSVLQGFWVLKSGFSILILEGGEIYPQPESQQRFTACQQLLYQIGKYHGWTVHVLWEEKEVMTPLTLKAESLVCIHLYPPPPPLCCFSSQKFYSFYSASITSGDNMLILWILHKRHRGSYKPTSMLKVTQKPNLYWSDLKLKVCFAYSWGFFSPGPNGKNIQALFRAVWFWVSLLIFII